ncbi:rhodanese-like domain-containing protein [Hazenella coriacea]|nr:rhodanese-like domain-containing protein [Hazenella coriacea]
MRIPVRKFKSDRLETMGFHEWLNHKDKGNLILIDVRPKEEYAYDHLKGAISIPIDELIIQFEKLPKDQEIVVYCRGSYCMYATEAVELLRSKGYKAVRLEAGIYEWNQLKRVMAKN